MGSSSSGLCLRREQGLSKAEQGNGSTDLVERAAGAGVGHTLLLLQRLRDSRESRAGRASDGTGGAVVSGLGSCSGPGSPSLQDEGDDGGG